MDEKVVILLVVATCVGARVIQDGEEDATCFPVDFESYRWVLAGNTWFSETLDRTSWLKLADECAKIEPGRTSLGGPRTALENTRLRDHFHDNLYYINAVQIGGKQWYWYTQKTEKSITMEKMTWQNWSKGEPSSEGETCGMAWHEDKKWNDGNCVAIMRGICELRCDSL